MNLWITIGIPFIAFILIAGIVFFIVAAKALSNSGIDMKAIRKSNKDELEKLKRDNPSAKTGDLKRQALGSALNQTIASKKNSETDNNIN